MEFSLSQPQPYIQQPQLFIILNGGEQPGQCDDGRRKKAPGNQSESSFCQSLYNLQEIDHKKVDKALCDYDYNSLIYRKQCYTYKTDRAFRRMAAKLPNRSIDMCKVFRSLAKLLFLNELEAIYF